MTEPPFADLSFANPPLVELALDLQFEALADLNGPRLGLLWGRFRSEFPRFEQHAALAPLQVSDIPIPLEGHVEVQIVDAPPTRLWFLNDSGTELIQVQPDRFVHNWRRQDPGEPYPRYENVRARFEKEVTRFQDFLTAESIGPLMPTQCAITYFNHIVSDGVWQRHGQLHQVWKQWAAPDIAPDLPEPTDARLVVRYPISARDGHAVGQLTIALQPAFRRMDGTPIFVTTLTAQATPEGETLQDVLASLDLGHEWALNGFMSLTTPQMHEAWGIQHAAR